MAFYRGRFVHHQLQRGASIPQWREPRNCADARYLADVWAKRAKIAHGRLIAHRKKMEALTFDDFVVRDGNHAWHKAVRVVQRAYPGTESWLLSCSSSEGGHGKFVQNSDGANVWGWLQFAPGTFSGFVRHAISDVRSRGYRVPESAWEIDSVLGQALAGAWGITHGMRHHWAGSGC